MGSQREAAKTYNGEIETPVDDHVITNYGHVADGVLAGSCFAGWRDGHAHTPLTAPLSPEVWLRREGQAARCAAMQAAHDAGDGEVVRLMLYGEAGPAADIEAAAHGALWESASDTSGEADDPMDAWLERMDRPMDEFDISTEDYLGVMQGRVRLEDVGAC